MDSKSNRMSPSIYVAGNHEYCDHHLELPQKNMRNIAENMGRTSPGQYSVELFCMRFLGAARL
jgi:hypothetical protein